MERFIHQQNLELYRKLLADPNDKDEARHQMLLKLLADEVAWDRQPPPVKKKGPPARHLCRSMLRRLPPPILANGQLHFSMSANRSERPARMAGRREAP